MEQALRGLNGPGRHRNSSFYYVYVFYQLAIQPSMSESQAPPWTPLQRKRILCPCPWCLQEPERCARKLSWRCIQRCHCPKCWNIWGWSRWGLLQLQTKPGVGAVILIHHTTNLKATFRGMASRLPIFSDLLPNCETASIIRGSQLADLLNMLFLAFIYQTKPRRPLLFMKMLYSSTSDEIWRTSNHSPALRSPFSTPRKNVFVTFIYFNNILHFKKVDGFNQKLTKFLKILARFVLDFLRGECLEFCTSITWYFYSVSFAMISLLNKDSKSFKLTQYWCRWSGMEIWWWKQGYGSRCGE